MPRKSKEQERKERQYKRQNGWQRENTKIFALRLSKSQDGDMIDFLDSQQNKADYLKKLIRRDMNK